MKEEDPRDRFEYDISLSFAGENRAVAEHLAQLLVHDGVRVFYDAYETWFLIQSRPLLLMTDFTAGPISNAMVDR